MNLYKNNVQIGHLYNNLYYSVCFCKIWDGVSGGWSYKYSAITLLTKGVAIDVPDRSRTFTI